VWFVRAVTEMIDDQIIEASEWSVGRTFTVPAAPSAEEMQRALDVLKRWETANGSGSPTLFAAAAPAPATDSGTGWGTGSGSSRRTGVGEGEGEGHRKSVPTASAAIRGEHPDTTGEKYGVVGTSASPNGAGVAAANLDGGPDLVLDGSADAEPDARLYEWGLERESATDGYFQFINPGAGALNLEVDGTVAATGLDCPDCVTSAEIANLSITGADLADDSVSGAKIGDGAVDSDDLAVGAVTGIKIAAEAVDSRQIRAGAVENTHLADGAVTAAKIADGTITAADISPAAALDADTLDGHDGSHYQPKIVVATASSTSVLDLAETCQNQPDGHVTITAPGPGTLIVEASVTLVRTHLEGTEDSVHLNLSPTSGDCGDYGPQAFQSVVPSNLPNFSSAYHQYIVRRTVSIGTAGSSTCYLNAFRLGSFASISSSYLTAVFYPD